MRVLTALLLLVGCTSYCTAGIYDGVTVKALTISYMAKTFKKHKGEFERLTGAKIEINEDLSSFQDVLNEIEAEGEAGFGHDIYLFTSTVMPQYAEKGYLEDLTDWVQTDATLEWNDVVPFFRKNNVGYNNRVYALPYDGDLLVLMWRKDLMDSVPLTLEDLVEKAKELNGKDHNGDGIPDRAWCECMGPSNDSTVYYILGDHLMQFVAPYLQTKGSEQGAFFDPTTLKPLVHNPGFKKGMKLLYDMFTLGSNSSDWQCDGSSEEYRYKRARELFLNGSCVFSSFWSSAYMVKANRTNAYVLDKMSHAPFPGSMEVVDGGDLKGCTEELCPFAAHTASGMVNFAPFAAYGGFVGAVNSRSRVKKAAYDFLAYCNQPSVMKQEVVVDDGLEPFRRSQLDRQLWENAFPNKSVVNSFLDTTSFILSNGNILVDLRIPGAADFITTAGYMVDAVVRGEVALENAGADLEARWEKVINANGGRERLLPLYRASLNLPPLQDTSSGWSPEPWQIALIVVGVILLLGVAAAATVKASQNRRMYELQFDNNVVAERCATAIADMNLEQVDYLKEIENPNKIQQAFMQIVERLKQYKAYMPQSLFAANECDDEDGSDKKDLSPTHSSNKSKMSGNSGRQDKMKMAPVRKPASLVTVYIPKINMGRTVDSADYHTVLLNTISSLSKQCMSVMVYTTGDYTLLALNAASSCATHPTRACKLAKGLESALREIGEEGVGKVGISASSGNILVANCGTEAVRSFMVMGNMVLRGRASSEIAADFPFITPLADDQIRSGAAGHMQLQAVTILPEDRRGSTPQSGILYHITEAIGGAPDEWMYELQNTDNDPVRDCLLRVIQGDAKGVQDIEELQLRNQDPVLHHTVQLLQKRTPRP